MNNDDGFWTTIVVGLMLLILAFGIALIVSWL
jgi:hypothetical protein